MANEKSLRDAWLLGIVLAFACLVIVLSFFFSSRFVSAPGTFVVTPTPPPTVTVPLPPPPLVIPTEVVRTPIAPPVAPSVEQPEFATPPVPTLPLAIRAEVVEVKDKVEKVEEHLTETVEEFRKKADDLDLGE